MKTKRRAGKRDLLIDTAMRLFAERGYHATGIDTILAEAGIAKMTLYHHFRSKEELIVAALRRRDEQWRNWFMRRVERAVRSPRGRLLAVFDVLHQWFRAPDFHGCAFINAAAEAHRPDDPVHRVSAEHKRMLASYLTELATAAGATDPAALAEELMLLMDGAVVTRLVSGDPLAARRARRIAETLVETACARG